MTLDTIPQGTSVFVDANTFVYHFAADPQYSPSCKLFFERVDRHEIVAVTSTHELSDVAHKRRTSSWRGKVEHHNPTICIVGSR